jgi:putative protein-disulfide isomerase
MNLELLKNLPFARPVFIYVMDPLCGWCYGFAPVMDRLAREWQSSKMAVEVLVGGLAIGERAGPVAENFSYIKDALSTVEDRTGVRFGHGFHDLLDEGTYMYDSMPPCTAMMHVQKEAPSQLLSYTHGVQKLLFQEGRDLNQAASYADLNAAHGIDHTAFEAQFNGEALRQRAILEFNVAHKLGVQGFPATVYCQGDDMTLLHSGYVSHEPLAETLEKLRPSAE